MTNNKWLFLLAAEYPSKQPAERVVVLINHSLLERYDCVIRYVYILRTYLGATLGYVAIADSHIFFQQVRP